jgi:hypothetical protein
MLPRTRCSDVFWQAFRRYARKDHDNYVVASFGDVIEIATELADLVVAEIKRAAASLACDYGEVREATPRPGDPDPCCRLADSPERGAGQASAGELSGGTHFLIINNPCSSISTTLAQ